MIDSGLGVLLANAPKPNLLSPLNLAYVGDAIYELVVRTVLISKGNVPIAKLNEQARAYVRASFQAQMFRNVEPHLTEEERAILMRGRNASPKNTPKNAKTIEYRLATAVEALFGYLYLMGRIERLLEIFELNLDKLEKEEGGS